ncbi:alpha/beta fold hydrolase [Microbacterium azadirachtae]|uniref:alpha/beta fold hydrolase n=1 Tax=Microbacterium azadirachtae TaxID=582680 RepID=UPI00088DA0FE|nr:alpha/beta hydrolase [Microbacterium azadirachtae]SDM17927.1 Pimeloyl-ACP methyl ester carboxylesterase [Microbacterium azadirachtae]SEG40879.1 Pimeloyl-ACP methyl ester carboxylesterase [Microbacterium azadirachtae]SEG43899.1 Pimeloyl-ACP methyl ester carboxylesterase [Microbacterium azadirachtae]
MTDTLFDCITSFRVETPRYAANVRERPAADPKSPDATVVFVHGNVSSSLYFVPTMQALPAGVRALAIDLRGFGDSETKPVDAARGLRDFADDVRAVLDVLGLDAVHLVGWSMGGGVVLQVALDAPERVLSLTLEAPVSPYGFGGTHGADGIRNDADGAGTGGGGANPDFVARLEAGDTTEEAQTSPRTVYRTAYVAKPEAQAAHEDLWVASMLTTKTGPDNYPGDAVASENWPGFAAGTRGVLNTMAPQHLDLSGIVDLAVKPPILWIHGDRDAIVSDASFFDLNHLGALGVIPGWPGDDIAPAQPMVTQTRAVLERYAANGGSCREVALPEAGHAPHLDEAETFDRELAAHLGV